jgi:hypothetical protein
MNEKTDDVGRQVKRADTTEYSGSKAPETRKEAEEQAGPSDERLQPGGARGSKADVGMSSLDRDITVSGARSTGQQRVGDTKEE